MDEGIKLRDRIYHISTGTVVLDSLLSGDDGAPLTSILVIDELKTCCFAKPLFRCFIAEGQDCKQSIFVASPSRKIAQNLVENIPSKILTTSLQDSSSAQANREETERMKIAWRYNTMPAVDSSISSLQNHKAINKYDLSKKGIDLSLDTSGQLRMFNSTEESFKQPSFQDLWKELHPLLESDEFSANCKGKKKVLRVVLTDLSSPVWADPEKLPTFLGLVKTFLRHANAFVMLSIDSSLLSSEVRKSIMMISDAYFSLEHISDETTRKAMGMGKVDGRFYVIKLPSIGASAPQQLPDSIDLTFTLKRQCFVVEIFHLPPALGDEPSRTSSDLKATRGRATCQTLANDF